MRALKEIPPLQVNHVDLSPTYAGTLMGITNTFANICGFLAPYVSGSITKGNVSFDRYQHKLESHRRHSYFPMQQTLSAWGTVFLLCSGVHVIFNLIFVAFGSGEVQPWDYDEDIGLADSE